MTEEVLKCEVCGEEGASDYLTDTLCDKCAQEFINKYLNINEQD